MKYIKSFNQLNEELDISTRKSAYDKMSASASDSRREQAKNMINKLSGPSEGLKKEVEKYLSDMLSYEIETLIFNYSIEGWGQVDECVKLVFGGKGEEIMVVEITKNSYDVTKWLNSKMGQLLDSDRGFMQKLTMLVKSIQERDVYTIPPINYNSGAHSLHLNFDINKITNKVPFIYPGVEYTTGDGSVGLLREFAQAIQRYDLTKIGMFFNGERAYFDKKKKGVSCGSNNLNMREIPKEIWRFNEFRHGPYDDNNFLNGKQLKLSEKIDHLEEGKIYVVFSFRDDTDLNRLQHYTGVIDVTEPVKEFIEKSNQLN